MTFQVLKVSPVGFMLASRWLGTKCSGDGHVALHPSDPHDP